MLCLGHRGLPFRRSSHGGSRLGGCLVQGLLQWLLWCGSLEIESG